MSDFARLEDKLAKLRQRERIAGEGRRLRGATPEALLAAVVTEIDETILPRRLSFAAEGGQTVHLAVANRRLQALLPPAPDVAGVDAAGLAGRPLPDADAPEVPGVKDVLLEVFRDAPPVAIRSARQPGVGYASDVGVPSTVLARVWGAPEEPSEAATPEALVSRFLAGIGEEDAVAWLRIEGENVTDQGGEASAVEALGDQAAMFLDGYFARFDTLFPGGEEACATLIAPVSGSGAAALFVEFGDVSAFVAAKPDRGPALVTRWQRLTGG